MPGRLVVFTFVATKVFRFLVFELAEPVKLVRLKTSRKLSSVVSKLWAFCCMYVLRAVAAFVETAFRDLAVVCLVGSTGLRFVHEVSFLGLFWCLQGTRAVDASSAELVDDFFLLRMIMVLLMFVVFPSGTTIDWDTMMLPLSVLSTVSGSATVGAQKRKIAKNAKNMAYHAWPWHGARRESLVYAPAFACVGAYAGMTSLASTLFPRAVPSSSPDRAHSKTRLLGHPSHREAQFMVGHSWKQSAQKFTEFL